MDGEIRGPLPRFEANAGREIAEPRQESKSEKGLRLVSEDELNRERSFWSEKLQSDIMRLQTGCYERMQELLSFHESRMKGEMRAMVTDREAERPDSVQGDSGGSREGTAALGSRMTVLEMKLTTEQSKVSSALEKLEEVKAAVNMLGTELAEERRERQDIGQLAQMAINTTRCLTEMPSGAATPSTAADTADGRIWEQLAGRLGAISQELRSEVRSELLVALRTEFQAEMARKMATFQSRIVALEGSIGGTVTKVMQDISERVSNLEAAQADATQVRERLLALEEQKEQTATRTVSPVPSRTRGTSLSREVNAPYSSQFAGLLQAEDIDLSRSLRGLPVESSQPRANRPTQGEVVASYDMPALKGFNSRSASPLPGKFSPMSQMQTNNVCEGESSRGMANSGIEDSSTMSVGDSTHEELHEDRSNLMSLSLKSELEGLVTAVSSIIQEKPKNAGNVSRQPSGMTQRPATTDRAHLQRAMSTGAKAKTQMRKPMRSASPHEFGAATSPTSQDMKQVRHMSLDLQAASKLQQEAGGVTNSPRTIFDPGNTPQSRQQHEQRQQSQNGFPRPASLQTTPGTQQRIISPNLSAVSPDPTSRGMNVARLSNTAPPWGKSQSLTGGSSLSVPASVAAQPPAGGIRPGGSPATQGTTGQQGVSSFAPGPQVRGWRASSSSSQ